MSHVKVEQRIIVTFLRETPEVSGPRGWAEGAQRNVEVERHQDGLLLKFSTDTYLVPAEVVEALYDVWQEVPVGKGYGLLRPSAPGLAEGAPDITDANTLGGVQ